MPTHSYSHSDSYVTVDYRRTESHEHFRIACIIQVERGDTAHPCAQADEAAE